MSYVYSELRQTINLYLSHQSGGFNIRLWFQFIALISMNEISKAK